MEGRTHGIRANSISRGVIETNQTREQLKDLEWSGYMLGKTQSWAREYGQVDKWIFCLTTARLAEDQEIR
jgi:NAD(P)-dependent dehydrogenase (short-subunit alcohol dehydrogenase family)